MSLPTKDKYEELKEKRKQEQEKRLQQERLVRLCTDTFLLIFYTHNELLNILLHVFFCSTGNPGDP